MKFSVEIRNNTQLIIVNLIRSFSPQVTWFKDNRPVEINRNGRLILSNENSLLIASIEKSDAGNYTCVASNIAGSYSSEPAELIVHGEKENFRLDRIFLIDMRFAVHSMQKIEAGPIGNHSPIVKEFRALQVVNDEFEHA